MTIYNLGNIKGEKGDRGECAPGPTGPQGVGIKSIEQITHKKFKFCLTDGSEYIMVYGSQPATLSLVSDKDILVPDEVANITATVLDENDNPLSGQTVTIEVRKQSDDSLVETLSVTDEGDGTYTASYLGQGTGDIYIKADCMILTKTFSIEDLLRYLTNASQFASGFSSGTDGNYQYITGSSSNHSRLSPLNNPTFPNKFQIEFDYYKTTNRYGDIAFMGALNTKCFQISMYTASPNNGKCGLCERITDSSESNLLYSTNGITLNTWHHVVFTYDNGNITFKVDNETVQTVTDTNIELSSYLSYRINNTSRIANLKVKPL